MMPILAGILSVSTKIPFSPSAVQDRGGNSYVYHILRVDKIFILCAAQ
jgi:hypothetical protein